MLSKLDQEAMKDEVLFRVMLDAFTSEFAIDMVLPGKQVKACEAKGNFLSASKYDEVIIHMSRMNDFFDGVSLEEGVLLRYGFFWNEILHLEHTPANLLSKYKDELDETEYMVFRIIYKILEDAAIVSIANNFVGGPIIESLKYMINRRYDHYPQIENESTAFRQYMNAIAQVMDKNNLKGSFTYPEAEALYKKTSDELLNGAQNPDGEERAKIALNIVDITRDLWMADNSSADYIKTFLSCRNDGFDINYSIGSYDRDTFIEELMIREGFEKEMNGNIKITINKPIESRKIEKLADHEFKDLSENVSGFAKSLLDGILEIYKKFEFSIYLKKVGMLENSGWILQESNKTDQTETWIKR